MPCGAGVGVVWYDARYSLGAAAPDSDGTYFKRSANCPLCTMRGTLCTLHVASVPPPPFVLAWKPP